MIRTPILLAIATTTLLAVSGGQLPGGPSSGGRTPGDARPAGPERVVPLPAARTTGRPDTASSAAVLALLPDGERKRRFLLDCTGCHVLGVEQAFPGGRARGAEEWERVVERMLSYAGATTDFPVIAADREPGATGAWLARHWTAPPEARPVGDGGGAGDGPEARARVEIREYDYPAGPDLPHDLIVDREGRPVVTGMFTHRMLRLDPETGVYELFPIPVEGANPRAVEIDAAGDWWVLLGGPRKIARYRPADDEWTTFDIGVYGHSVRVDEAGRVWFNGHFTRDPPILGFVDPDGGEVETFDVPTPPELRAGAGPIPYGLRVGPDGRIWGTELHGNRLVALEPDRVPEPDGALEPGSGAVRTWTLPTPHAGPRRLDVGPDGRVWIPEYAGNALAAFDPSTETFVEHPLPIADALPYIARVHPRTGRVWIATGAADAVFVFDPATESFATHRLPARGALVRHMDVDPRTGAVWLAYGAAPGIAPKIARIAPR